eukprot:CAMPEP_0114535792 /NCGR_PEP_ID=MMETSP0109-20121206/28629_1 /TAXON_ID=29199 /ORGANISM="Chlorarachnion reptans, Strain CCCM449" /LENGTH=166 /DNA_ID=CAMNT_0001719429 /DNA_START=106 /DNA_END=606 /DNA_ORIENTATION=+
MNPSSSISNQSSSNVRASPRDDPNPMPYRQVAPPRTQMMQPSDYLGGRMSSRSRFDGDGPPHEQKYTTGRSNVFGVGGQQASAKDSTIQKRAQPSIYDSVAMEKRLMELSVERDRLENVQAKLAQRCSRKRADIMKKRDTDEKLNAVSKEINRIKLDLRRMNCLKA